MNSSGLSVRSTTFNTPVSRNTNNHIASASKMAIRETGARSVSPVDVQPQFMSTVSSEQKGKKKDWVGSASKRLRLPKLREKASTSQVQEASMNSKDTTRKLSIGPTKSSVITPTPAPRPQQSKLDHPKPTKKSSSPADKPLPSLPVAVVDYNSPVRRSLIDCAERPLRRSLSPPDGGPPNEEDWPSIQPSNRSTTIFAEPCKGQIKPSLGESIIDGLRNLNLQDNEDKQDTGHSIVDFGHSLDRKDFGQRQNTHASLGVPINDSERPLSSSQLPKPRESMLHSLSRHTENPVIRQTKTSAMRLQNAMGKKTWSSGEKSAANEDALSSIQEQPTLLSKSRQNHGQGPGPIRSASRGRHAVTVRGSPYIIPSRAPSRANTASPANQQETNSADQNVMVSIGLQPPISNGHDNPGRKVSAARNGSRQSSLPIPSRLKDGRASTGRGSISPQQQSSPDEIMKSEECAESENSRAAATGPASSETTGPSPTVQDSCINLRDALSSPVPQDQKSVRRPDYSENSTRGYDAHGGFRLKLLGHGLLDGPTLRINDSASRILLGTDDMASSSPIAPPARSSVTIRRKRSAPELNQRKDQMTSSRPTSAIFDRPLSFIARNIADRTSEIKVLDDDEVRKLIGEGSSPSKFDPVELPGSDVVFVCDSRPSSLIAKHVTRESWGIHKSPPSVQCDWPGKDFAEFNLCPSPDRSPPKAKEPSLYKNGDSNSKSKSSIYTDAEPSKTGSASIKSITSRPSTIALRAPPSREIAPFLFQNTGNEEMKGKEPVRKVSAYLDVPGSAGSGDSTTTYPPRISSRKPKPPPIIVSPPQNAGPTISIQPRASNTREIDPDSLKKPRNVKTFSQSVSPHTDSTKARKAVHKLGYAPSSSSKKVISNIRGLFHKRSVESDKTINDKGAGSFRHSLVPNPLRINASDAGGGEMDSDNSRGPEHGMTRAGPRNLIRNPFISPTTPFTAGVKPSPYPSKLLSGLSTQQRDNRKVSGSVDEATTPPPLPSPAETLSNATNLTHSLLDLAHMETDLQRKSHLIQMSKCMVEVVGAARDAEKAMEKAKMEAARAEVSWLKVQKTMGEMVEHVVKVDSLSRRGID